MIHKFSPLFLILALFSCGQTENSNPIETVMNDMGKKDLDNEKIRNYSFLDCMYADSYFPSFLVDKCQQVLLEFCHNIEIENPENNEALYVLSHRATIQINGLQNEFFENGSEIETAARECLAANFEYIANAYNYDTDVEMLIATREW